MMLPPDDGSAAMEEARKLIAEEEAHKQLSRAPAYSRTPRAMAMAMAAAMVAGGLGASADPVRSRRLGNRAKVKRGQIPGTFKKRK